jgi:hypothetical protein
MWLVAAVLATWSEGRNEAPEVARPSHWRPRMKYVCRPLQTGLGHSLSRYQIVTILHSGHCRNQRLNRNRPFHTWRFTAFGGPALSQHGETDVFSIRRSSVEACL